MLARGLIKVVPLAPQHSLRKTQNTVERCAKLVRRVCEELVLQFVEALELVVRELLVEKRFFRGPSRRLRRSMGHAKNDAEHDEESCGHAEREREQRAAAFRKRLVFLLETEVHDDAAEARVPR